MVEQRHVEVWLHELLDTRNTCQKYDCVSSKTQVNNEVYSLMDAQIYGRPFTATGYPMGGLKVAYIYLLCRPVCAALSIYPLATTVVPLKLLEYLHYSRDTIVTCNKHPATISHAVHPKARSSSLAVPMGRSYTCVSFRPHFS